MRLPLAECFEHVRGRDGNRVVFWSKRLALLMKEFPQRGNTLYIDDLRIDDQSSMLASSFLSKSTIEIDDPTVSRPDF